MGVALPRSRSARRTVRVKERESQPIPLLAPGDQGERFVEHNNSSFFCLEVWPTPPGYAKEKSKRNHVPIVYGTLFRLQAII
jgi:hypothetical protein